MSRSFWEGVGRGFAAPSLIFVPLRVRRIRRFEVSVERAWKEVDRALRLGLAEEKRHGKEAANENVIANSSAKPKGRQRVPA